MNAEERNGKILEFLNKNGEMSNQELSQILGVSVVTVRAAVRTLEKNGLLIRTHGGAKSVLNNLFLTIPSGNIYKEGEIKKKIAQKAYELIADRETVILDDSSNSYYLAEIMKEMNDKHIVVITNSLAVANVLCLCPNIDLILTGGYVSGKLPATTGEMTSDNLAKVRATKAFIGVHGIHPKVGITSVELGQMLVKQAILKASEEVYVLANSSKFGGGYLSVAAALSEIKAIITDDRLSATYYHQVQELGVEITIVSSSQKEEK